MDSSSAALTDGRSRKRHSRRCGRTGLVFVGISILVAAAFFAEESGRRTEANVRIDASPRGSRPRVVSFDRRLTKSWSNPNQAVLTKIDDSLWMAERPYYWNTLDVGGRMAVVKLSDDSLWVHSPVPLDQGLRKELDSIGVVKAIIAPNFEHTKYAKIWKETEYPDALLYGCPGLKPREPLCDIDLGDGLPNEWENDLDMCFLDYEHNPFTKKSFFNEVVFVHKPSETLITADLFWNYPENQTRWRDKSWKLGMDKVYLPFYTSLMVKNKGLLNERIQEIFKWKWDSILPCHGSYVPEHGRQQLLRHLWRMPRMPED
mmetsp:Transcript_15588/g.27964  ORF Transcript_15588/g.27964 Transcript_15588/m.27964 type:complete len:317 (+) Transcript_15588:41-991(+)